MDKINYFFSTMPTKTRILLLLLLVLLLGIIIIPLVLKGEPQAPQKKLPAPPASGNYVFPEKIPVPETQQILQVEANGLHWLNNNELAYFYFDSSIKQRSLAITNIKNIETLVANQSIKFSETYWSNRNDLLVFEYGDPYKTLIYRLGEEPKDLNIQGYGFSWNPSGESFFYKNLQDINKIYDITQNSETDSAITYRDFEYSYWSPSLNTILLYDFDLETGLGKGALFSLRSGERLSFPDKNIVDIRWSPKGGSLAYRAQGGLFLYTPGQSEAILYQTSTPEYLSYSWLNDEEMLIFDSSTPNKGFFIVNIFTLAKSPAKFSVIEVFDNQKTEITLSPDKKIVAFATAKNGLIFIKNE